MDLEALQTSFQEAIHHVHHNAIPGLTENIEKRLFGLFQQVTLGPAPLVCPDVSEEQRLKWQAHAEVGMISRTQAMQAYIDLVGVADPRFLFDDSNFCGNLYCWQTNPCLLHDPSTSSSPLSSSAPSSCSSHSSSRPVPDQPVYVLAEARDLDGVVAALEAGADPNTCDELGVTGLMWAADSGNEAIAQALLSALPLLNVNQQDGEGQTALHYAVQCDSFAIAKRLMDAGAEVSLADGEGLSPLDLALREGLEDYVQLFLERGMLPVSKGKVEE